MTKLQNFTVIAKLGQGAFGQVFKVKRNADSQEYAMKKVKIGTMKEKQRQNAVNEVRILASLCTDFIIGYKEAFYDQPSGCLCIIMEFASGGDILKKVTQHKRKNSRFPEEQIWKALGNMLQGLKFLHDNMILHRDLKCANIFINADGTYKLGDLNVSKVLKNKLARTQTGTPYYASPEIWRDQPYDGRSDIWSLGCVIYQMSALRPPFQAHDLRSLFNKIQKGFFDKIPSCYSTDLWTVITSMLKVNPAHRPTAQALLSNSIVVKRMGGEQLQEKANFKILNTIKFSAKDLKSLQAKLPKANYQLQKKEDKKQQKLISERKMEVIQEKKERAQSASGRAVPESPRSNNKIVYPQPQPYQPPKPPQVPTPKMSNTPSKPPIPVYNPINHRAPSPGKPPIRPPSREKEIFKQKPAVNQKDSLDFVIRQYQRIKESRQSKQRELKGCSKQMRRQPSYGVIPQSPSRQNILVRQNSREVLQRKNSRDRLCVQPVRQPSRNENNRRPMSANYPSWWG